MTYFTAPNGIQYKSKLEYYRTIEDQGLRSHTTFFYKCRNVMNQDSKNVIKNKLGICGELNIIII